MWNKSTHKNCEVGRRRKKKSSPQNPFYTLHHLFLLNEIINPGIFSDSKK
jgi:hypothetical protein